ncbi:MAG: Spy/CpxP family protein refolding chaperone, partial [Bdellovibrionales bacterium]|nr:Spy/CpxP family protein refolding chaperone [Bdellovibrionales bacterium]
IATFFYLVPTFAQRGGDPSTQLERERMANTLRELNLTEEQKERLRSLKENDPSQNPRVKAHRIMQELNKKVAEGASEKEIADLTTQLRRAYVEMNHKGQQFREILTEEQRKRLQEAKRRRMANANDGHEQERRRRIANEEVDRPQHRRPNGGQGDARRPMERREDQREHLRRSEPQQQRPRVAPVPPSRQR